MKSADEDPGRKLPSHPVKTFGVLVEVLQFLVSKLLFRRRIPDALKDTKQMHPTALESSAQLVVSGEEITDDDTLIIGCHHGSRFLSASAFLNLVNRPLMIHKVPEPLTHTPNLPT